MVIRVAANGRLGGAQRLSCPWRSEHVRAVRRQDPLHTSRLNGRGRLLFADPYQEAFVLADGKHHVKPEDQAREVDGVQS